MSQEQFTLGQEYLLYRPYLHLIFLIHGSALLALDILETIARYSPVYQLVLSHQMCMVLNVECRAFRT